MFDFDGAIADWRQEMAAGGLESSELLDELECHLREEADRQERAGVERQRAFEVAARQIGPVSLLRNEFAKVTGSAGGLERMKQLILTLAGVPAPALVTTMNTSSSFKESEPRWATYTKAAGFLAPALGLWAFSVTFLFPKLNQICLHAGVGLPLVCRAALLVTEHCLLIGGAFILLLGLLEWRSSRWPTYRRAVVGIGIFVLNSSVLVLITLMVFLALVAGPALAK
jgi:hypothetical protein